MPILAREPDRFPEDLLESKATKDSRWWLMYTKSRQEKQLMRQLYRLEIPHYGPQIEQRRRSPAGRVRKSYAPLFNNYVFLCGGDEERYQALCTGCIQKITEITDVHLLLEDLLQISSLVDMGVPLSVEGRLIPGQAVRVRNGAFAGYEGVVIRRDQETRLLVSVRFMDQGVSVKLDDCQLESIGDAPEQKGISAEGV